MAPQTGPRLTITASCEGCEHRTWSANTSPVVALQSHRVCAHPSMGRRTLIGAVTPSDCPELPAARLALARSVVAAEAPCQVTLVRQIGGNLPCVRKGEHAEHQSACGRRWGGEDFTDHPDFDSRAFCDDGSEDR